jgi:hypothetical protein
VILTADARGWTQIKEEIIRVYLRPSAVVISFANKEMK